MSWVVVAPICQAELVATSHSCGCYQFSKVHTVFLLVTCIALSSKIWKSSLSSVQWSALPTEGWNNAFLSLVTIFSFADAVSLLRCFCIFFMGPVNNAIQTTCNCQLLLVHPHVIPVPSSTSISPDEAARHRPRKALMLFCCCWSQGCWLQASENCSM